MNELIHLLYSPWLPSPWWFLSRNWPKYTLALIYWDLVFLPYYIYRFWIINLSRFDFIWNYFENEQYIFNNKGCNFSFMVSMLFYQFMEYIYHIRKYIYLPFYEVYTFNILWSICSDILKSIYILWSIYLCSKCFFLLALTNSEY